MKWTAYGVVVVFFGVAFASVALAQVSAQDKQIIDAEHAVLTAFARKDMKTFRQSVWPDAFGVDSMMGIVNVDYWEKANKDINIETWNMENAQVRWLDKNTAMVMYRWTAKGSFMGQPLPSPSWVSSTWVNRNGTWKAMFHQESAAPPSPPAKK